MKKLIAMFLLLAMTCATFAACGETEENTEVSGTERESTVIDTALNTDENTESELIDPDTSTEASTGNEPDESEESEDPVSTQEHPSFTTTDRPDSSTSTQKPASTSTQKPSTSTQKPTSTSSQKPASTSTQKPSSGTTTDTPSASTQKPASTSTQKPASTSTQKPSTSTTTDTAPKFTTVNVPAITQKSTSIPAITQKSTTIDKAKFTVYNGTISVEDQVDTYTFTAPRDGIYRFQLSQMYVDFEVSLRISNKLGGTVESLTAATNNGVTAALKKGETYTVTVSEYDNFGSYTVSIGLQKPTVDVSQFTTINDSIEFIDQCNNYTFKAPIDGIYRFQFSQMNSELEVSLRISNNLGETVKSLTAATNNGVTAALKKGETYTVTVSEYDNFGSYTVSIGLQKQTVDVSQFTTINDSIEFIDQCNNYTFKAPIDGIYRFQFSQMNSEFEVSLRISNNLGETVKNLTAATNNGVTATLKKGETYTVTVSEYDGLGNYALKIWPQKTTTTVAKNYVVNDSIEYEDQTNIYSFTPSASGNYTVSLSGMDSSLKVQFKCLDDLDYSIASGTYANGKTVTLKNLTAGKTYRIQIVQYSNTGKYTLTIQ